MEILKAEGRRIVEEFSLASVQGEGSAQEVADFREHAVQDFVARFYPQSHIISKGKITDLDGNQSDSIDCLVLNPAHPNLVDSNGKFRLIFADACDSAIEVKPNLARVDELVRALEQCVSVKKTRRSKSAILLERRTPKEILEHSLYIPFFVFAVKAFDPVKLYSHIVEYYKASATPTEHQLDGVCVFGQGTAQGIVKNVKHRGRNVYGAPFPIGDNTGWYFEEWAEATPLGLLACLEYTFSSFPKMAASVMERLVKRLAKARVYRLGDGV
jgi:hypothetical protein